MNKKTSYIFKIKSAQKCPTKHPFALLTELSKNVPSSFTKLKNNIGVSSPGAQKFIARPYSSFSVAKIFATPPMPQRVLRGQPI